MTGARKRFRTWCLAMALVLVSMAGCGGYGDISPAAYDYAMALYAITNRRAEYKLEEVGRQIEGSHQRGELSDEEAQWLGDIVDNAQAGEWERANRASRSMMEDQVH